MDIDCTDKEHGIFKKIALVASELAVDSYVVGGFVRDKIIGRPTKDIDIVCVGDGNELANNVAAKFQPKPTVNHFKNFGTAQIKIADIDIEFVGARKESYSYDSRKPQVEAGTLEDDQKRRDFTINAMAVSLNKKDFGVLLDPFNGLHDIKLKILQTPLEPGITFSDDPLRMMRAVRFAAQLDYNIAVPTFEAIRQNASRIKIVSSERIAEEL
ncbi:MAG: tRNA nucleotidyltransferase, partial [Ferruginibacter sp.]